MHGKMQESGLKCSHSSHRHLSHLGPVSCFPHPELPWAPPKEWLQSGGSQVTGILPLPECPWGSPDHGGGLESLMTMTSLFPDMAGSTPYLIPKLSFPRAHVVSCVDTDTDIPSMERWGWMSFSGSQPITDTNDSELPRLVVYWSFHCSPS